MSGLQNKRILVTGGTTGIGFETAKLFQAEGARLIVTGANPDRLAQAREDFGPDVTVLQADSADIAAQRRLAAEIGERFGQLDAAFLNAGISDWRPIEDWDEAGFDRSFAVNVKGPYFLIQALLPVFANPASVVLNTSINAHIGMVRSSVYAATKAAYLSLIKTLSSELLPRGIRFNAVSPGPVDTPLFDKLGIPDAYRAQVNEQIVGTIPAGRFGKPSEIAQAVAYLASDRSAWTVGAELILDGGRLLNA